MIDNLGAHSSFEGIEILKDKTHLFQIFLHSPLDFVIDENKLFSSLRRFKLQYSNFSFVVHTPYWYNMQSSSMEKLSLKSLGMHLRVCSEYKVDFLITHTGTRNSKSLGRALTESESKDYLEASLMSILLRNFSVSTRLLLENTANLNTKGLSVSALMDVVCNLRLRDFNVGLAFDVEHAYARGEDLSRFDEYMEFSDLIHFNSIPSKVGYGSGLDRHTETPLYESVGISPETYISWMKKYPNKIKILEMSNEVALKTFNWLNERLL